MKFKSLISIILVLIMMTTMLVGCSDKAPTFTTKTTINYMSGDDSDWKYVNQQKEFPGDEHCYVRISCTPVTDIKEGVDTEIVVTYRFTYTGVAKIELSDGMAKPVEGTEEGVIEYTRILRAEKEKNAAEDIVIFQYTPDGEGSVTLEVIYDDQVDDRHDQRNTVYFTGKAADVEAGIH